MEKTIKIDGKDVRLKVTAAFPLRFNALTGKEYFSNDNATQRFYDVVWAAAKCADETIPDVLEWVESFESFPIFSVFNEVTDFISKSISATKNAKTAAGK